MPQGLIPLMLNSPDSVASFGSRTSSSPPVSPRHRRTASDITPTIKLSRPPVRTTLKRQSQQAPASLPSIPSTSAEWKRSITEIKQYHVTRRFRACAARCNEILSNLRNPSAVEPAYLIYLNFYAATGLEMCARPLTPASAYRISLLQQARAHYEKATALIRAAEESAWLQSRSSSAASSLPSLHSPSGSVSSRAWTPTPDSGAVTPMSGLSRKSSLVHDSRSKPQKKKVSFELPKDQSRWSFTLPEPVIRPDSPTLGFDDEYFAVGAMKQELPEVPTKRCSRQIFEIPTCSPPSVPSMPSISEGEELSPTETDSSSTDEGGEECHFFCNDLSDAKSVLSLSRYCETLSALKTQVASHMIALDDLLEKDLQLQEHPESPILYDTASLMAASFNRMSLQSAGRDRSGSNASWGRSTRSASLTSTGSSGELDELKSRDRQARIDRLRMSGWRRKRFDASRYEQLCDVVMEELNHS